MKEKAKKFWEEYGDFVKIIGYGVLMYSIGCHYGIKITKHEVDKGLNRIADVTPELTFGEFKKQVIEKTFDVTKYKV